ncbi:MAG TPA: phosphatidylglycerol lysyltransferase domain-containing protein, partial [Polyangiales bacterium]|nr:phosphatidylglycerol lysyltransferase domain-containing protein [Polyangiales bacterium]
RAKGLRVRRVSSDELRAGPTRDAIARIAARWLSERGMAPMSFLVHLDPFSFAAERTCFVAEQHGHVVAFAGVIPVPARAGWFVEDLVRDAHAPNGTSELLVDATMRWAAASGSRWVTLGLSPLAGEVSTLLRLARSTTAPLYDFEGVRSYKAKLRPHAWSPVYLAYPREQTPVTAVLDSLGAFAGGDLVGFGARSLVARVSQTRNLGSLSVPRLLRRRSPSAPLAPC